MRNCKQFVNFYAQNVTNCLQLQKTSRPGRGRDDEKRTHYTPSSEGVVPQLTALKIRDGEEGLRLVTEEAPRFGALDGFLGGLAVLDLRDVLAVRKEDNALRDGLVVFVHGEYLS